MADNKDNFYELFDIEEQESYVLPAPTISRVEKVMHVQLRSAVYQRNDEARFASIKEYGFQDLIEHENVLNDDSGKPKDIEFRLKEVELTIPEYVVEAAKILFPKAPVDEHRDDLIMEVVMDAVSSFLSKARGSKRSESLFSSAYSRLMSQI